MKKLLLLTVALAAAALLADSAPEGTVWSGLDLDTTSQTRALTPTYPIPYSTDWVKGQYDKSISVSVEQTDETPGAAFDLLTTAGEETGTYAWDYTSLDPEELPRTGTYSLKYRIFKGSTTYASGVSEASVTVLPEPGTLLFALSLMLCAFVKRF
ncbi:hypothetical protein J6X96_00760 [bacterium]|nr:hypothetical protein [bacterium]